MTIEQIIARWEQRRAEWSKLRVQVDGKEMADEVLAELAAFVTVGGDTVLTLSSAAAFSGYSVDHLSKLLRAGTIPNAGRKGAPRIRRKDLPLRPIRIASGGSLAYDAAADARRLQVRR